jgi:hypothetical protein
MKSSTVPSFIASNTAPANPGVWPSWTTALEAQFRLLDRLTLLCRHAARESQSARSPGELLCIHMNLQTNLAIDCAAFAMDCMRAGASQEGRNSNPQGEQAGAVAPILGAIFEPLIEGVQAAWIPQGAAPSSASQALGPAVAPIAEATRKSDAESHAAARSRPETPKKAAREGPRPRGRADEKPQARREAPRKRARRQK